MRGNVWIAAVAVSAATRAKVAGRHGLDVDEVLRRVVCARGLAYRWLYDDARGWRLLVVVWLPRQRVVVVLYPAPDLGDDTYRLASAYRG